jgi:histidinol-phosphate phosphatase family protein
MSLKSNNAIFLDRDGAILVEKDFVSDISQLEYIPKAIEALNLIPAEYLKIIISNQSGIGRGYFTSGQVDKFNNALIVDLKKKGVLIDKIYYCPHGPDDNCECRKPKTGLFDLARRQYAINFAKSWMIGDKSSDIQAGKNIGASTIQVLTGYAGQEPGALKVNADFIAENLYEAVEIIINER